MTAQPQAIAAKERADAIRQRIDDLAELPGLIAQAYQAQDWKTLGYESWQQYVSAEFGTGLIKLDTAMRKAWARSLTDAGMSTREIAPVVNMSFKTVARDLESVSNDTAGFRIMPRLRWRQEGSRLTLDLTEYRRAVHELADIYPDELQPLIIAGYETLIDGISALGASGYTLDVDSFNEIADQSIQDAVKICEKMLRAYNEKSGSGNK